MARSTLIYSALSRHGLAPLVMGCLGLLALTGATAQAATPQVNTGDKVFGTLDLYIRASEDLSPESRATRRFRLPFLSMVHVGARDVGVPGLSLEALGYGEVESIEPFTGQRGRGDLLLGTVTWRGLDRRLTIRGGRQLIYQPAANNGIIDGLQVNLRLPFGLQLMAWGGFTAEPSFDQSVDSWQAGARVAYHFKRIGHVAAVFSREDQGGEVAREVLGFDAAWRQLRWVQATGLVLLDTVELDLMEIDLHVDANPHEDVSVQARYRRFDPEARIPKTSLFSVFNDRMFDEFGGSVGWFPRGGVASVYTGGSAILYEDSEAGGRLVIRPRFVFDRAAGNLVGLEGTRTWSHDTGYWSGRLFGAYSPIDWLRLSGASEVAILDQALYGRDWSTVTRLSAGVQLGMGLSVILDGSVTVSPYVDQEWSGLLRVSYDLTGRKRTWEVSP